MAFSGLNIDVSAAIGFLDPPPVKPNPFESSAKQISNSLVKYHDCQIACDAMSLYEFVKDFVKSSTQSDESLVHQDSTVVLKKESPRFMPELSVLKEVSCELTCSDFDKRTAHDTIVNVLKKTKNYSWEAKAVIALSAFALVYGETRCLSRFVTEKDKSPELHILKFWKEDKTSQHHEDVINLVNVTLELIKGILDLEAKRSQAKNPNDIPTLRTTESAPYTYWAILALITCVNRNTETKTIIIHDVDAIVTQAFKNLKRCLTKIENEIASDLTKRSHQLRHPTGILELLKALILPIGQDKLEITQYTDKYNGKEISEKYLQKKDLLLFISGVYDIEAEVTDLTLIESELKKNGYQILWVPIGKNYGQQEKNEYWERISQLPSWYGLTQLFEIGGKRALEREWHYQGKPMLVVTNRQGQLVHMNALPIISLLKKHALPFENAEDVLFQNWNWFWHATTEISQDIKDWIDNHGDKYVFIYRETTSSRTVRFDGLLGEEIKQHLKCFELGTIGADISKFWRKINISFLSKVQKDYEQDSVLQHIQALLSYQNLHGHGWAVLSKGKNVLFHGYISKMKIVLDKFQEWKPKERDIADFEDYYKPEMPKSFEDIPCYNFQLSNVIGSRIPISMDCPVPYCNGRMDIQIVKYKCCHGKHSDDLQEEGEEEDINHEDQ